MDTESTLIEAIKGQFMVTFYYDNNPIVRAAPHAIYISTANNKNLDAYQFEGFSKSGGLPHWRNFRLSKIQNLVISDEKFDLAPGYNPASKKYNRSITKI